MRTRAAAVALALGMLLAACGTRVPDAVFEDLAQGRRPADGGEVSAPGSGAGEGTVAPGAGATMSTPGEGGAVPPPGATGGGGALGDGREDDGAGAAAGTGGEDGSNASSDVGVAPDRIVVGNITTKGGPLGPNLFTPMVEGAKAYFARLNQRGGVNGRRVELLFCDDKADPDRNEQCARHLVDEEQVFAFVANSTRAYSAADYVAEKGVPDVGGQPIGNEYFTYPSLFSVRGAEYPRDGRVGYRGKLYNGTAVFRFLKGKLGVGKAAVFYYNIPASKAYGLFLADAARTEGYEVVEYEVNPALPSFDSYVADMRAKGVDSIYDAMDLTGNQNLCRSMERNDFPVKAKVGIVSTWSRRVESQFPEICKRSYYVWGESAPYSLDREDVAEFRRTMSEVYGGQLDRSLAQWHLEGWLAAKLFTDGVRRMGADVTREGLGKWLNGFAFEEGYGGGGLIVPQSWSAVAYEQIDTHEECISVARWDMQARDFVVVPEGYPVCENVPFVAWEPAGG